LSANRILEDGPFASNTSAPFFPIGYPWFVAAIWKTFGVSLQTLGVVQNLILALAIYCFYIICRDFFGQKVSLLTTFFLSINPAISASISLLAYEIPMASILVLGFYLLYQCKNIRVASFKYNIYVLGSGILFSTATTFQPKILPAIIVIVLIFLFRLHEKISQVTAWLTLISLLTIISIGPAAAVVRNIEAGSGLGYTQNFSTNIFVGMKNSSAFIDFSSCPHSAYDTIQKTSCLLVNKIKSPRQSLRIGVHQGTYFWTPFIGNLKFMGTWYHGADWRRLIPNYLWWDRSSSWYLFDRLIGYLWTMGLISFILLGFWRSFHFNKSRWIPILFSAPVIFLWFVSVITYGEPRYRLPVIPFYTVFISIAIIYLYEKFLNWQKRSSDKIL